MISILVENFLWHYTPVRTKVLLVGVYSIISYLYYNARDILFAIPSIY